jgi:putative transposase
MGKKKFTSKQRLEILAEHDAGASISDLCRKHQISAATLYNWKKDKLWKMSNYAVLKNWKKKTNALRKCTLI